MAKGSDSSKKIDKKTKEIINSLRSKEDKIVMTAIKRSKVHGNDQIFKEMLKLLAKHPNEEIKGKVLDFIDELKQTSTVQIVMEAAESEVYSDHRARLIGSFWKNNLQPKDHLDRLVKLAAEGDFLVTFECLTVIENLEPPFEESKLNDSMLILNEYFGSPRDENEDLMKSILYILRQQDKHTA